MVHAMHVSFGRLAFRPESPEAIGTGVMWAFAGELAPLTPRGTHGPADPSSIPGMSQFLRKASQFGEMRVLADPEDGEVEDLRRRYFTLVPERGEDPAGPGWRLHRERARGSAVVVPVRILPALPEKQPDVARAGPVQREVPAHVRVVHVPVPAVTWAVKVTRES